MKFRRDKSCLIYIQIWTLCILLLGVTQQAKAATVYDCENGSHRNMVVIEKPAEMDEAGIRSYTCELCGISYEEEIPKLGHSYGDWIVEVEADCVQEGLRYRICEDPAHEIRLPAIDHQTTEHEQMTDTEGREEEIIPAGEHNYIEDGGRSIPASCESKGLDISICTGCGQELETVTAATGHAFGEWEVIKEASLFKNGVRRRLCANDQEHVEEEIITKGIGNMTVMDKALATANTVNILAFFLLIRHDYIVILWNKRKVKMLIRNGVTKL